MLALPFLIRGTAAAAGQRPNILFIMTDDHAAHAISCYGSKVNRTPNLDRIANEGMRFDRCFATNSICTPSRASILTGKYSHMNGVPVFNRFDGSQPTVQKMLQQAGYYTAMIGKWHLGSDPTGFDHWNILPGQGRYIDPILYDKDGSQVYPGYATDVITDLTIEVLEEPPEGPAVLHDVAPQGAAPRVDARRKAPALFRRQADSRTVDALGRLCRPDRCASRAAAVRVPRPDPARSQARARRRS